MLLIVNGETHEHSDDGTLSALLAEIGATPEHTVLTVNGSLIVSKEWGTFKLANGDSIELLTFVGGG